MRQIKFRAWDKERNKMITDGLQYQMIVIGLPCPDDGYEHSGVMSPGPEEYDRFDIEQFTGLKDNNGKDIYEGDILQGSETSPKYVSTMERARWGVKYKYKGNGGFVPLFDRCHLLEVIGNIHENPELLNHTLQGEG